MVCSQARREAHAGTRTRPGQVPAAPPLLPHRQHPLLATWRDPAVLVFLPFQPLASGRRYGCGAARSLTSILDPRIGFGAAWSIRRAVPRPARFARPQRSPAPVFVFRGLAGAVLPWRAGVQSRSPVQEHAGAALTGRGAADLASISRQLRQRLRRHPSAASALRRQHTSVSTSVVGRSPMCGLISVTVLVRSSRPLPLRVSPTAIYAECLRVFRRCDSVVFPPQPAARVTGSASRFGHRLRTANYQMDHCSGSSRQRGAAVWAPERIIRRPASHNH